MSPSVLFSIAGWIALGAALISSICWVCISIAWWRMEKRRVKKLSENPF